MNAFSILVFVNIIVLLQPLPAITKEKESSKVLTQSERDSLQKFKSLVQDRLPHEYMKTDFYLLKFLKHHRFDANKAKMHLMQVLKWREENNIDNILSENFSDVEEKLFTVVDLMRDRAGQPVIYFALTGLDIRSEVLQGREKRILRYIYRTYEEANALLRKLWEERNVTKVHTMIDETGVNFAQFGCLRCIGFYRDMINVDKNWPEFGDKTILVNVPSSVRAIIEILKSFSTQESIDSLTVVGTNKGEILSELKKNFDLQEIPKRYGGLKHTVLDLE